MPIKTKNYNPYSQRVRDDYLKNRAAQNALTLQGIQQDEAYGKQLAQRDTDLANQGWERYRLGYDTDIANLKTGVNSAALQAGNARGSWAADTIAHGAQRQALETGLTQAQEDWQRQLADIDTQAKQRAQGIANRMAAYNLDLAQQGASDWADTHYWNGGGGGGVPTPPPPPNTSYVTKATPGGSSPSLYKAVTSGAVPAQAAGAYTGVNPTQNTKAAQNNPYYWWMKNH